MNMRSEPGFLFFGARLTFIKLRQVFIKVPILYHFNSKYHILIETNTSKYVIGKILRQLTLDNFNQ